MKNIFILFTAWKILDLTTAYVAPNFLTYKGLFAFPDILLRFNLPPFIESFANFDGIHYIRIASEGYHEFEHAFFPLYPLLVSGISHLVGGNTLIAGLLVSNLAFLGALIVLYRYLKLLKFTDSQRFWILTLLLCFPTSFFFGALYTESLFLLFTISSLYFLKRENFVLAGILGFFSAVTRLMGVFLIIPFIITIYFSRSHSNSVSGKFTLLAGPIIGLASYCLYLFKTVGDPLAFVTAQNAFARSTNFVTLPQVFFRYIKILLTTPFNIQYFVACVELGVFTIFFVVLVAYLWKFWQKKHIDNPHLFGLSLFSLVNLLLPTVTGTLLSIPRIALLSLSVFILLGSLKNKRLLAAATTLFAILHIILLSLFVQGYFVS